MGCLSHAKSIKPVVLAAIRRGDRTDADIARIYRAYGITRETVRYWRNTLGIPAFEEEDVGWAAHHALSRYLRIIERERAAALLDLDANIALHITHNCAWWHRGKMMVERPGFEPREIEQVIKVGA